MNKITLATLPQATAQEVFDQVAVHLLKQKQVSFSKRGTCSYRGADGLMCAAGCLIGDDEYNPEWDFTETNWDELAEDEAIPFDHFDLIASLQAIHDGSNVEDWEKLLRKLANSHTLNTNAIDKEIK